MREQLQTETIDRRVVRDQNYRLKQQEQKEEAVVISEGMVFISFMVNGKISLTPAGGGSGFLRQKQK